MDFSARLLEDGYYVCEVTDGYGRVASFKYATADGAIAKARNYVAKNGLKGGGIFYDVNKPSRSSSRGPYGPRTRNTNAQWGRPTKRQSDYRWGITKLFGEIHAKAVMASSAAASAINVKVTEASAKELLARVYAQRGKYNTYTGNLERAYMATVVSGRKAKKTYYLEETPKGFPPMQSKRSGRLIVYMYKMGHEPNALIENIYKSYRGGRKKTLKRDDRRRYKRQPYRYFKPWERKDGYRMKSILAGRKGNVSGFGLMAGDKHNRVQSGIIIENTAPYAGAVQAKGYQVMPSNAMLRSYSARASSRQEQMAMIITKNMLHAAKLI